jgi:ParB-like chromosome segregation protein Spo0J
MQLAHKPLSWFREDPANPRQHPESQLKKIEAAVRRFGFRFPVSATASGQLIAGHGRLEVARRLGLAQIPTIVLDDVDDRTREALALLDNRIPLDATWDQSLLLEKIRAVLDADAPVTPAELGLDPNELDRLEKALASANSTVAPIVDASDLALRFVAVISGPIEAQPEALKILEKLEKIDGIEIKLSDDLSAMSDEALA